MPGFADAGAGTAYVPKAVLPRRTAASTTATSTGSKAPAASATTTTSSNADDNHDGDAPSRAEETFSEAGTELHDNRTNKNSIANRNRYYNLNTSVIQDSKSGRPNTTIPKKNNNTDIHNSDHAVNTSNDSIEVEATFGFFPSTKPPPSPSPRGNAGMLVGIESNDKLSKTPKRGTKPPNMPLSPSPQPVSPPPVTRKQLATKRVGDTDDKNQKSGVETKTSTIAALSPENEGSQNDKGNIHDRPFAMQRRIKREVSTFSLAPETGAVVEREENQAKLKQWKEKEIDEGEENVSEPGVVDSPTDTKDDGETSNNDGNTTTRRLDLNALQEIDRMESEKQKQTVGSDELSTSSSIVSSTCSEFGTVIQMGDATMAMRMKEVEEMELAALAEVPSGEEEDTEHRRNGPQLSSTSLLQHDNSLKVPILDSSSSGKNDASNAKADAKTTVATANSTVNPMKRNPTKSEMISAAFRRVNLNNTTALRGDRKVRNSLSAPTTPLRVQSFNQSRQPPDISVEGQESSPSRYESASDVGGDKKTRILSPRFASFLRGRGHGDTVSSIAKTASTTKAKPPPPLSPRVAITQTFQYAQKCFANDNTLTEYGANDYHDEVDLYDIDERRRQLQDDLVIPPLGRRPTTARLAPRVLPLESSSFLRNRRIAFGNSTGVIRTSQSLDHSSSTRSPFRELPSSTSQRYPFLHHSFPAPPPNETTTSLSTSANINLRRVDSDFSPSKVSKRTMALNSTMELRQPDRIEIEREDALDILACLVEQGIADWNSSTEIQNIDPASASEKDRSKTEESSESSPDIMKTAKEEKTEEGTSDVPTNSVENYDFSDYDLEELIEDFKKWIKDQDIESNSSDENGTNKRQERRHRSEILQELVKSHAYAVDMKRASTSASAWLKSIGRGQGLSKHELFRSGEEIEEQKSNRNSPDDSKKEDRKTDEKHTIDKMDLLTLKATLHSAKMELTETKQLNSRLNEELSKCRTEIGRIKSISRIDHMNKSILDDSSEASGSKGESDVIALKNALDKANDTIRRLHSDLREKAGAKDEEETEPAPVVDVPRVQVNKTQPRSQNSTPDSTHRTVNVRMLDGENFVTDWDDLRALPPPPDHSLQAPIVFAVLEQWTPDRSLHESLFSWMDNVMKGDNLEDLPPLTLQTLDHQVRDGFTMHVLPHLLRRADIHVAVKTRTHRKTTYDMSVTVSQKTEGTTESSAGYFQPSDLKSPQSLLDRMDSMSGDEWGNQFEPRFSSAESVAHSAVTETITNHQVVTNPWDQPPQTPVQTEYSEFSSQLRSRSGSAGSFDESLQQQKQRPTEQNQGTAKEGTIMGALGGALSGLLSRNKYAVSPSRFNASQARFLGSAEDNRNAPNNLPASLRAQMDLTSSPTPGSNGYHRVGQLEATLPASIDNQRQHRQEEPYHRVVSAPPGRIGLTFVEFRGHAMVSDVAMDSPLAGWVFPSDILIAIDEIPVSGMRVRDIVTIISDRKNRQRAMRVMSGHDMNEFTMMSQVGGPLNEDNGEDD